jgi:hypothetical protein
MTAVAPLDDRELRIRSILETLLVQRRRLESAAAEPGLRDANRLAIVYWEWQLSQCRGGARERQDGMP